LFYSNTESFRNKGEIYLKIPLWKRGCPPQADGGFEELANRNLFTNLGKLSNLKFLQIPLSFGQLPFLRGEYIFFQEEKGFIFSLKFIIQVLLF